MMTISQATVALTLSLLLLASAAMAQGGGRPWDAGVEKPCPEAVNSALYIRPVPPAEKAAVAFTVTEQMGIARKAAPVRGGIPFHRGELAHPASIRLLDEHGTEVPVQGLVTSYWPERSVRWLCIDFVTDIAARQTKKFTLEFGAAVKGGAASPLRVVEGAGDVQINTGRMRVAFSPGRRFCGQVARPQGGTAGEVRGLLQVSQGGEAAKPVELPLEVLQVKVVEKGPVQATVYLRGAYGRETVQRGPFKEVIGIDFERIQAQKVTAPKYAFHAFVRVYADSCRMEVVHSFGYNGDENSDFVRRYGLVVPLAAAAGTPLIYGGDLGAASEAPMTGPLTLTQGRADWWRLSGAAEARGRRFGGWAALKNPAGMTAVALRDAWQQWPVTIEARPAAGGAPAELALYIYGAPEGEFLDLRYEGEHFGKSKSMYNGPRLSDEYGGGHGRAPGLLKISELVLDFQAEPEVGPAVHVPLVPFAGPERIARTKALGHVGTYLTARPAAAAAFKLSLDEHLRWARALLDFPVIQHEANGLYGWVDWPDQGDTDPVKDGKFQLNLRGGIGWSNSERALLSYHFCYAAGGPEMYLHLGHAMALHTLGIDMEHPGGEMAPGALHRHDQVHWREGGEPRQCGVRGWYADYWMTGNPEVRRVLLEVYQPPYAPLPGPGPEPCMVCEKGASYNYPNLLAYLTTNDPIYIKHHKAIDQAILDAARQGHAIAYDVWRGGAGVWKDGRITLPPTKPGQIGGYWCTYGGDDRLAEHASLFGYAVSVAALKAWGDSWFGEGKTPPRNSPSGYTSPEAGFAAYYLLTGNRKVADWLAAQLTARPARAIPASAGPLLEWDAYAVKGSADQWQGLWAGHGGGRAPVFGKNAFKIQAANVFESLYALAALEHAARSAE